MIAPTAAGERLALAVELVARCHALTLNDALDAATSVIDWLNTQPPGARPCFDVVVPMTEYGLFPMLTIPRRVVEAALAALAAPTLTTH